MAKKLNKKDFIFENKENETLIKSPGEINGRDFLISNLKNCEVFLCDYLAQVFIKYFIKSQFFYYFTRFFVDDCVNCRINIGPIEGSLFVRDCSSIFYNFCKY